MGVGGAAGKGLGGVLSVRVEAFPLSLVIFSPATQPFCRATLSPGFHRPPPPPPISRRSQLTITHFLWAARVFRVNKLARSAERREWGLVWVVVDERVKLGTGCVGGSFNCSNFSVGMWLFLELCYRPIRDRIQIVQIT